MSYLKYCFWTLAHQPCDRASGHHDALTVERAPHLANHVYPVVLVLHTRDVLAKMRADSRKEDRPKTRGETAPSYPVVYLHSGTNAPPQFVQDPHTDTQGFIE